MDKIIYKRYAVDEDDMLEWFPLDEPHEIELSFQSDLTLSELKTVFIRLCFALGYQEQSIKRVLGTPEDIEFEVEENFNLLAEELGNSRINIEDILKQLRNDSDEEEIE